MQTNGLKKQPPRPRKSKPAVPTAKGLLDGQPEAGVHVHAYDEDEHATAMDGAHVHKFALPDGSVIETELGGIHQHRAWDGAMYVFGGDHVHRIVLPDGTEEWTEIGGCHDHQLQDTSTLIDGPHRHVLVLPDGSTVESLLSGEEPVRIDPAPPVTDLLRSLPSIKGRRTAVWSRRKMAGSERVEVRFAVGDKGLGWAFDSADLAGLRHAKATPLPLDDTTYWLPSHEDTAAPDGATHELLGKGHVEQGLREDGLLELFVEGAVAGVIVLRSRGGAVTASLTTDAPPLCYQRGEPGPVPELLGKMLPAALRWWCADDPDEAARRMAKARELRLLDDVAVLDGVLQRVRTEVVRRAWTPSAAQPWTSIVEDAAPTRKAIAVVGKVFKRALIDGLADPLLLLDAREPGWGLARAAGIAKSSGVPAVVAAVDVPESRAAAQALGHAYLCRSDLAADLVIGSTVPLEHADLVPLRRAHAPANSGRSQPESVTKALDKKRHVRLLKDTAGEAKRLVYGVVYEPDTVDAHGDTMTAEDIEVMAHEYLAKFANVGWQHYLFINTEAEVVESYIAPADFTIGDQQIKKGTWMMTMHILDDALWKDIQDGNLTGYSFGGFGEAVALDG